VNLLIVNAYSARNRGDGMIVSQMVRLFRERGCAVKVMSDDPEDGSRYGVERLEPLVPIWPSPTRHPSKRATLGSLLRDAVSPRHAEDFLWADVCVSAGGGYLYDDGGRTSRLNTARRLIPLRAARRRGRPVVLFSQSIGPFASSFWRSMVARELGRADLVLVREELSEQVCREMGVATGLCDDIAFALEPGEPPDALEGAGRETIGVTVMNALPGVDQAGHRRYVDSLVAGLARGHAGRRVAVISQVSAHAGDDDVGVGREVTSRLGDAGVETTFVDLGHVSDEDLSAFYGGLKLVVASRLHSGILALCAGTPIIGLSYLPKTDGVLARLGLERWVLQARDLDGDRLAAVLADALGREGELREHVGGRLPAVRESARRAIDLTLETAVSRRNGR
jgi:colanic acid/amylovoran biosynthesis protein